MTLHPFDLLPLSLIGAALVLMLRPQVRNAQIWRATVTPLASIIGSGFLIVAPLLANALGVHAWFGMLAIVLLSLWVGAALRYNILRDGREPDPLSPPGVMRLERLSEIALALAYVISVAFYLRLMAAFVLDGLGFYTVGRADGLAAAVTVFIGVYGWRRGLHGLENLEEISVSVKLAIISGLLLWLAGQDWQNGYDTSGLPVVEAGSWEQVRLLAGMLLVVQGFETSKYLDSAYDRALRARSMWHAQLLAGGIYLVFVFLALPVMGGLAPEQVNETAIITLSAIVTPLLPPLLILAAVMSQFSAAVADTLGAGGVAERETRGRLPAAESYLVIGVASAVLILLTDIFELVAIASRAFALYYLLQVLLTVRLVLALESGRRRRLELARFVPLTLVLAGIVVFGKAVEG